MSRPVLILDGYSLLFRAFYALPPMTARAGVPTGGLYGVSVLLVKLLREERPAAVAIALDTPGPTVRHASYAAYKAGRAPAPDPLRAQIGRLPELAEALGAPVHRVAGWEADDVIASLCGQVRPALVVTGDTDLLQLVDEDTTVLFVGRRQKEHVRYDLSTVRARYGFDPMRIPTYKALVGDPSDNLPGVPGIGAKTASRLIVEHGDAAAILLAADRLPPRQRHAIAGHAPEILVWEALATLRSDLPLEPPLTGKIGDHGALRRWFEANEFRSLLPRLDRLPSIQVRLRRCPTPAIRGESEPFAGDRCLEAVLQALWRLGPDGLSIVDAGRVVDANDRLASWVGQGAHALVGRRLGDLVAPVDGSARLEDAVSGTSPAPLDVRPTAAGTARILEVSSLPMVGTQRLVLLRDVTDRRREQSELLQKRTALEGSFIGYDIVDDAGRFLYANRAYLDLWGYGRVEEIIGTSAAGHCADPDTARRIIEAVAANGHTTMEFTARRRDGSTFEALMAVQASVDAHGNKLFIGTSLDVTEQRHLAAELVHFQKLEAMGTLASSVAHEFNNLLSPILGFADLLLEDATLSADHHQQLKQMQLAARRSRELTSSLLSIGSRQFLEPRPTELRTAVTLLEPVLVRMLREDIRLVVQDADRPCWVLVDAAQLQQVLLNLTANARDAMPNGGTLTIGVGQRERDDGWFGELVVADDGVGMDAQTVAKVFEPFFSTKGRLGTGLGLAAVLGIVRQHHGEVRVDSEPGRGTAFRVLLPLTTQPRTTTPPPPPARAPSVGAEILVVEDNDLVRNVVERILTRAGHQILTHELGGQAIAQLGATNRPVDLLITDLILPDMNGRKLAEAARELQPGLRVLFMSGYTDDAVVRSSPVDADMDLLQKPFSAKELVVRVHQALGRAG